MTFEARVAARYGALSKSQRKIARHIRENANDGLFLPLTQLAQRAQTSPATLVRFARALGYSGYPDMQRALQAQVAEPPAKAAPQGDAGLAWVAEEACLKLAEMYRNVSREQLGRIARLLMKSPRVLVIGYMDAFGVAAELFHRLHCFREGLYFSRFILDWNDMLRLMSPETVFVTLSFTPHYAYTHTCITQARARGSRVVLITDSPLNPFAGLADETVAIDLAKRPGQPRLGGLNLSPVTGFISLLMGYIEDNYPSQLLEANRHDEIFVEL